MPYEAKNILLIEDSATSAALVRSVLCSDEGEVETYVIERVESLAEGLEAASKADGSPIDVVLLDLTLPDSSGLETLSRFHDAFPELPVLVLTGTDDEAMGLQAHKMGAQNYLIKDQTYPKVLKREVAFAFERKRQQKIIGAALHEAEEATKLKDKFVSLVAHDLRGPLGAMMGLLEVMLEYSKDPLTDDQRETVKHVYAGSESLLKVVEELLDISRLATGKVSPKPEFLDAYYLVDGIIGRLQKLADDKGIVIENTIAQNSRIYADPTFFAQVLQNVLSNAIKFCPLENGRVICSFSADATSTVTISDNGAGIPQDVIPKMFRIEEKISTSGTAGEKGTGFGMPLSADIMHAHGGELGVTSTLGAGSAFLAKLPKVRPLVMVIDDELVARNIVKMHMESIDVDVITAEDGREALRLLDEGPCPHLIVSDIVMPELDGFALLTELKSNDATKDIPVIMVTGDDKIETREKALGLGADDFTVKPVVVQDFIPRVRRFVG